MEDGPEVTLFGDLFCGGVALFFEQAL